MEAALGRQLTDIGSRFIKSPARIRTRLESMSEAELSAIYENLSNYSSLLKLAAETGVDPRNDAAFLVLAMREMRLKFPSDFLDILRPKEVVEAYDMNRRQIFRNLHFLEISSYSLLELLSYDWPMLFQRDAEITELIIRQAEQDMWAANYVIRAEVPVHYIRELLCEKPQVCEVQQLYFAPLFAGPNKPGGALSVCAGRSLGPVDRENLSFIR
jgi:hypothetical protein